MEHLPGCKWSLGFGPTAQGISVEIRCANSSNKEKYLFVMGCGASTRPTDFHKLVPVQDLRIRHAFLVETKLEEPVPPVSVRQTQSPSPHARAKLVKFKIPLHLPEELQVGVDEDGGNGVCKT
ncbi:unnamed protein product [Durusdinium trenchii]|uniref:MSP domain-containing protein n=1 Tax=Durusdinium trenchii TaxID=1381693 RepID=A0ABP0QKE3_9DINO